MSNRLYLPFNIYDHYKESFMNMIAKLFKVILVLAAIPVGILLLFYFFAPIYHFSAPQQFKGTKIYNPYKNIEPSGWLALDVTEDEKFVDSTIVNKTNVVAENQNILMQNSHNRIQAYTHGFNFVRTKQICIGSQEVLWIDLAFFQTTGLKQYIIDRLEKHNKLIALESQGYSFNDLKKLTRYNLWEILNGRVSSIAKWDTALSAGQPAFLLADNRLKGKDFYSFTMVNTSENKPASLIHSLNKGSVFGVKLPVNGSSFVSAGKKQIQLPFPEKVLMHNDTLLLKLKRQVKLIRFIRQGGRVAKSVQQADSAFYVLKPDDQYIRTEIMLNDGTVLYLNPVIRYNQNFPVSQLTAKVDVNVTGWLRLFYFAVVAFLFWFFTRKLPGKKTK